MKFRPYNQDDQISVEHIYPVLARGNSRISQHRQSNLGIQIEIKMLCGMCPSHLSQPLKSTSQTNSRGPRALRMGVECGCLYFLPLPLSSSRFLSVCPCAIFQGASTFNSARGCERRDGRVPHNPRVNYGLLLQRPCLAAAKRESACLPSVMVLKEKGGGGE